MNATIDINDESDRAFLGHPRGLAYIAFTEAWERFSYYGMQTLLVLYMVNQLLLPGHIENIAGFGPFRHLIEALYGKSLSTVALASAIFGLYAGFVYLTPIFGGYLADKVLGKTRTIILGALSMALGHFLMAFDVSFLIALSCLLFGVGCFKGNLASQVSELYSASDLRRADAFQIYYLFINGAVIAAPLVVGNLKKEGGWHYGFGAAGVGMIISIIIYLSGRKWLPKESVKVPKNTVAEVAQPRPKLTKNEWITVALLIALVPILALSSVGNQQIFNAYMLWVPEHINMVVWGYEVAPTDLISLDATVSVAFLSLSLIFWRWWGKKYQEPNEINKITIGAVVAILGIGCLWLAAVFSANGQKASFGWVLGFEVLNAIGFANLFPVGLALFARAAPKGVASTIMGIYYLNFFMSNNLVGWLGGKLEEMSGTQFWAMHAAIVGFATLLFFIIARFFGSYLDPQDEAATNV